MMDMKNNNLLKLYELAINEEHHFLEAHQSRVAFYTGIVSALAAGTVAGLFQVTEWYHLLALCVGPLLIFVVSSIAIKGTLRLYQRFLEAVTTRAKIEQELGLTGNALIVAPTPEKKRPNSLIFPWQIAEKFLIRATRMIIFGFAFNPYDEAVLNLLSFNGNNLKSVLIIDIKPNVETAKNLWPDAEIISTMPPPTGDNEINNWCREQL